MTLTALIDLIAAWTGPQGQAYVTSNAMVTDVINRESKRFAADTLCLYNDSVTLTMVSGTAKYSLRDTTAFSKQVVTPVHVWVNGNIKIRVAGASEMAGIDDGFHELDTNEPTYWYTQPPNHIVFRSAPDSAYAGKVEGWVLPDDVEYPDEGETDPELEFEDDIVDTLAVHIAIAILAPRATGDLLERVNFLRQANAQDKAKIRAQSDRLFQPAPVRRRAGSLYNLG